MKHLLIAVVIGVLTIGISIFVLSDRDSTYEDDAEEDKNISLNETFEGENYDLTPLAFTCEEFTSMDESTAEYGCVLSVELTNTTIFEQILNLDGDNAVSVQGVGFPSSDESSRLFISENGLTSEIDIDETVTGGIFFDVPEGEEIEKIEVFENSTSDPISIVL